MIAVTVFAGKKVAVFGLGGSGLTSASALLAGGADVIGWDDGADAVLKATSAGIPTADLRQVDWSKISALVLAPGVPLTHPAPHWTVALVALSTASASSSQPMTSAPPASSALALVSPDPPRPKTATFFPAKTVMAIITAA